MSFRRPVQPYSSRRSAGVSGNPSAAERAPEAQRTAEQGVARENRAQRAAKPHRLRSSASHVAPPAAYREGKRARAAGASPGQGGGSGHIPPAAGQYAAGVAESGPETLQEAKDAHSTAHGGKRIPHGKADWQIVWEGQKKSHQVSLRMLAIAAFAALAVLIVITPLRAFIGQQEQIRALNDELAARKAHISELNDTIALWKDPKYVQSQARQRLGYVMPGQTLYYVTGKQGQSAQSGEQRIAEANKARRAATPFYMTMWDSITMAGQVGSAQNPQGVPVIPGDRDGGSGDSPAPTGQQPPAIGKPR